MLGFFGGRREVLGFYGHGVTAGTMGTARRRALWARRLDASRRCSALNSPCGLRGNLLSRADLSTMPYRIPKRKREDPRWSDADRDELNAPDTEYARFSELLAKQGTFIENLYIEAENTTFTSRPEYKQDMLREIEHFSRYEWENASAVEIKADIRRIKNIARIKSDIALRGFVDWTGLFQIDPKFENNRIYDLAQEMADKSPTLDAYDSKLTSIMTALEKVPGVVF